MGGCYLKHPNILPPRALLRAAPVMASEHKAAAPRGKLKDAAQRAERKSAAWRTTRQGRGMLKRLTLPFLTGSLWSTEVQRTRRYTSFMNKALQNVNGFAGPLASRDYHAGNLISVYSGRKALPV